MKHLDIDIKRAENEMEHALLKLQERWPVEIKEIVVKDGKINIITDMHEAD